MILKLDPEKDLHIIGDVHGSFDRIPIPIEYSNLVFIGDLGDNWNWYEELISIGHSVFLIRGNHDDQVMFSDALRLHIQKATGLHLLAEVELLSWKEKMILCIAGAISIDRNTASERNDSGISHNAIKMTKDLIKNNIEVYIMISHTSPANGYHGCKSKLYKDHCFKDENLDRDVQEEMNILQQCFDVTNAKKSVFGHLHSSYCQIDKENRSYQCLDVGEVLKINL